MDSLIALAFLVGVFYAIYATMSFILRKIKTLVWGNTSCEEQEVCVDGTFGLFGSGMRFGERKTLQLDSKVSKRQEIAAIQG